MSDARSGAGAPRRILLIQTAFLGDMVFTTPLIRTARERFPRAELAVLATPAAAQVLHHNPRVDRVLVDDKRGKDRGWAGYRRVRGRVRAFAPDLVLSPHKSLRSGLLARAAGARERIGFRTGLARFCYTRTVPFDPAEPLFVERHLALARALGWPVPSTATEVFPAAADRERVAARLSEEGIAAEARLCGVSFGSVWATKQWPGEYYAALGDRLATTLGWRVLLLGSEAERAASEAIAARMTTAPVNWTGRLDIPGLIALCERLHLHLGGDSGGAHIARAAGTPAVTLFGPTREDIFAPTPRDLVLFRTPPCRPCGPHGHRRCPTGTHECMGELTPDLVFEKIQAFAATLPPRP